MDPMIAGIVLFTLLTVFAFAIGVISSRDDQNREANAGNPNP